MLYVPNEVLLIRGLTNIEYVYLMENYDGVKMIKFDIACNNNVTINDNIFKNFKLPKSIESIEFILNWADINTSIDFTSLSFHKLIKNIIFYSCAIQFIENIILPPSLEKIYFMGTFNEPIDNIIFPKSTKGIYFGCNFNQPIEKISFPQSTECVVFGVEFNQPIDKLYELVNLKELVVGRKFCHNLDNLIKFKFLEKLTLNSVDMMKCFSKDISQIQLPDTIKYLVFGRTKGISLSKFNFPQNIEHVIFDSEYNESIDNINFPPSIKKIDLGNEFNKSLNKVNFRSIKKIRVSSGMSLKFVEKITTLEKIKIDDITYKTFENVKFPESIHSMTITETSFNDASIKSLVFPSNLKNLRLFLYDDTIGKILPETLERLKIHVLSVPLTNLHSSLKELYIEEDKYNMLNYVNMNNSKIPFGCKVVYFNDNLYIEYV